MAGRPESMRRGRCALAGAGIASVAASVALLPTAAEAGGSTPVHATPGAPDTGDQASKALVPNADQPDYGFQKIRIGAQIKSGAYIPPGTTTAGSVFDITETGPGVSDPVHNTCTTDASTATSDSTATYCRNVDGQDSPNPGDYSYEAQPGDTVTVTQKTAAPGLRVDPITQTAPPCIAGDHSTCPDTTQLLFTDRGLAPTAKDDSEGTLTGHRKIVDVQSNDDAHGAPAKVRIAFKPLHGTATVTSEGRVRYDPKPGFVGSDFFYYVLTTANGSSSARVSLSVLGYPPTANDDDVSVARDTKASIDVRRNDVAHGGELRLRKVHKPENGTARIVGGNVTYTPAKHFTGVDHFSYVISTHYGRDTAEVTVVVHPPRRH